MGNSERNPAPCELRPAGNPSEATTSMASTLGATTSASSVSKHRGQIDQHQIGSTGPSRTALRSASKCADASSSEACSFGVTLPAMSRVLAANVKRTDLGVIAALQIPAQLARRQDPERPAHAGLRISKSSSTTRGSFPRAMAGARLIAVSVLPSLGPALVTAMVVHLFVRVRCNSRCAASGRRRPPRRPILGALQKDALLAALVAVDHGAADDALAGSIAAPARRSLHAQSLAIRGGSACAAAVPAALFQRLLDD